MTARFTCLSLFAMLCAAVMLSADEILAFSLQDYEGGVQLGTWRGSLEGGYQFEDQSSSSPTSSSGTTRNRFDEVLEIKNNGIYLIDPRLLTASAGLDLDMYQEQDRASRGSGTYSDGLLWGYSLDTTLFPQFPENLSLFANQNQNVSNTSFGGRTQNDNSSLGLLAQLNEDSDILKDHGLYYFNSRLLARTEQFNEKTTQLGQTYRLDEERDVIDYLADKGFQTADLRFRYEFDNEHDSGTNHLAFQTQNAGLNYSLIFGPDLNRSLNSDAYYYSRSGSGGDQKFLSANETLHIDHYQNLFSTYQYQLQYNDVPEQGSTTYQWGQFELAHHLFTNLSETLLLGGLYQTLSGGDIKSYWIGGSGGYNHAIPWHGNFFLNINGQYQIQENNLSSSQISVTNESHTLKGYNPFFLNNTFVITSTIMVFDQTQGGKLTNACVMTFTPLCDYLVISIGNQTQIAPNSASPIIKAGDTLQIDYIYQVPASAKFSTTTKDVSVGVIFPWIDMSYAYDTIDQNAISGNAAQFLEHQVTNTFNLGVHHDWEVAAARADATYQTVESSTISFNLTDFTQNATYRPGWNTILSLTGNETFNDYTKPIHRSRSYSVEFNGDRSLGIAGTMSMFASLRSLEDSEIPTQKTIQAGLQMKYLFGKLQVAPSLSWYNTTWGGTSTSDLMLEIRVTRFLF